MLDKTNKNGGIDEVALRTTYAYHKALSLGQKILAQTFQVLRKLKNKSENDELGFTPEQKHLLSKEIAILSFFWLTRDIWTYVVKDEQNAKKINSLLYFWFKGIKDSEIEKYVKAAGTSEEVQIFGKNIAEIFDCYGAIAIYELNIIPVRYFEEYTKNTKDAFTLPMSEIQRYLYV
ncbi:MAG: hypothetical protein WCK61_05060 [Candidatus Omnitrophota bacterium]